MHRMGPLQDQACKLGSNALNPGHFERLWLVMRAAAHAEVSMLTCSSSACTSNASICCASMHRQRALDNLPGAKERGWQEVRRSAPGPVKIFVRRQALSYGQGHSAQSKNRANRWQGQQTANHQGKRGVAGLSSHHRLSVTKLVSTLKDRCAPCACHQLHGRVSSTTRTGPCIWA